MAIESGDAVGEYYHLKVTSDGTEILQNATTDAWGNTFPPYAKVIYGYFCLASDHAKGPYTLNEGKEAIVYDATICFICSNFAIKQINSKDSFYISEKTAPWHSRWTSRLLMYNVL